MTLLTVSLKNDRSPLDEQMGAELGHESSLMVDEGGTSLMARAIV